MGAGSFNPNGGTGTVGGESYTYAPVGQTTANNAMQPIQTVSPGMGVNPDGSYQIGTPVQQGGAASPFLQKNVQDYYNSFSDTSSQSNPNPNVASYLQQSPINSVSNSNMPMATNNVSNPNTATLGTGQFANPYVASTNPYIQAAQATTMGNLYGAQAATQANRINQNTPYGSLNYSRGVDANGNPTWTANQQLSQPLQNLTNTSLQGLQQSLQNPMYGINPGQTYSDAIMQRLSPQLAQQSESNTAALANQGIVPGTKAYENAMRTFQQGQNDLLTSAQIQGMQTGLSAQSLQNQQAANIKALGSPGYVNPYSQAAVAGPDYLGAYTTANAAQIAAQNAANARTANTQNGLFGLGSAALLGGGGIGSLGTNGTGGSGLLGLGGSAYNSLFGNNGLNNPFTSSTDYMNNIGATSSGAFDPALSNSSYLENLYGNLGIF